MTSRIIKFRGKSLSTGEWVYGYYYCRIIKVGGEPKYIHIILDIDVVTGDDHEVDPKTVGQYIGVNDKNNVEIYEDDFYIYSWDQEKYFINKVRPGTGSGNHSVGYWTGWELADHPKRIEIIGNQQNTPSLMPNERDYAAWKRYEYNPELLTPPSHD